MNLPAHKGDHMRLFFLLTFLIVSTQKSGAADGASTTSLRMEKPYALTIGIGAPMPSIGGLNFGYNIRDWVRPQIGYGEIEVTTGISFGETSINLERKKATTISAGADFMVPGWNLTPVAGLHVANLSMEGKGQLEVQGFKKSGTHVYSNIGLDWQAQSGFKIGGGYQVVLSGPSASGSYLNAGWSF